MSNTRTRTTITHRMFLDIKSDIYRAVDDGTWNVESIASKWHVGRETVYRIKRLRTWKAWEAYKHDVVSSAKTAYKVARTPEPVTPKQERTAQEAISENLQKLQDAPVTRREFDGFLHEYRQYKRRVMVLEAALKMSVQPVSSVWTQQPVTKPSKRSIFGRKR